MEQPLNNKSSRKKAVWLIILVLLILLGSGFWFWRHGLFKQKDLNKSAVVKPTPEFKYLEFDKLPPNIPSNLPLDKGAQITQNYQGSNHDNGQQTSVRQYLSKNTPAENVAIYEKYFADHSFKVLSKNSYKEVSGLTVIQNQQTWYLTISPTQVKGFKSLVDVTFVSKVLSAPEKQTNN